MIAFTDVKDFTDGQEQPSAFHAHPANSKTDVHCDVVTPRG